MAENPEGTAETADPIVEQGEMAKELKLAPTDCPYVAQGDNRAKWFSGFGQDDPEAASE